MPSEQRKYSDEQYLDFVYFADDDECKSLEIKIVKTRKEHECVSIFRDPHLITVGTRAILEKAIHVDKGRVSCYLCLNCADEYLNEHYD